MVVDTAPGALPDPLAVTGPPLPDAATKGFGPDETAGADPGPVAPWLPDELELGGSVVEAEGRLAHLADALAPFGGVLGAVVGVQAEAHL